MDPHEQWASEALLKETGLNTDILNFPLLVDPTHTVSAAYGVAFQMRIHTELCNRPATFIIDRDGVLRYARRGKTYGDRPSPKDLLTELEKIRE